MRFEVPQFIEVEDKIIGPFTWKQFVFLAGGGGAVLVLYFVLPFFLFALIGLPIGGLAGFLAFHQVNNRPFSDFLESVVTYTAGSKLYLWRKQDKQVITNVPTAHISAPEPTHLAVPSSNNIASLSRRLELEALQKK